MSPRAAATCGWSRIPRPTTSIRSSWKRFAVGLHEPLGILAEGNHSLYVVQRPEMSLLRDTNDDDVADEYDTVCDGFGISGNYHEFAYGPVRNAAGDFFATLNLGFQPAACPKFPIAAACVKIGRDGAIVPWAFGTAQPERRQLRSGGPALLHGQSGRIHSRLQVAGSAARRVLRPQGEPAVDAERARRGNARSDTARDLVSVLGLALGGRTGVGYDGRALRAICRPVLRGRGDQFA